MAACAKCGQTPSSKGNNDCNLIHTGRDRQAFNRIAATKALALKIATEHNQNIFDPVSEGKIFCELCKAGTYGRARDDLYLGLINTDTKSGVMMTKAGRLRNWRKYFGLMSHISPFFLHPDGFMFGESQRMVSSHVCCQLVNMISALY